MKDRRAITAEEIAAYRTNDWAPDLPDEELVKTAGFSMWLLGHRFGVLVNQASRHLPETVRRNMRGKP